MKVRGLSVRLWAVVGVGALVAVSCSSGSQDVSSVAAAFGGDATSAADLGACGLEPPPQVVKVGGDRLGPIVRALVTSTGPWASIELGPEAKDQSDMRNGTVLVEYDFLEAISDRDAFPIATVPRDFLTFVPGRYRAATAAQDAGLRLYASLLPAGSDSVEQPEGAWGGVEDADGSITVDASGAYWGVFALAAVSPDGSVAFVGECANVKYTEPFLEKFDSRADTTRTSTEAEYLMLLINKDPAVEAEILAVQPSESPSVEWAQLPPNARSVLNAPEETQQKFKRRTVNVELPVEWFQSYEYLYACSYTDEGWGACYEMQAAAPSTGVEILYKDTGATIVITSSSLFSDAPLLRLPLTSAEIADSAGFVGVGPVGSELRRSGK